MRVWFARPEIAEQLRREALDRDTSTLSDEDRTTLWRIRFAGANLYHVDRWRQLRGGQVFWNPAAATAASRSMSGPYDLVPALRAHRCPIRLIIGDHDFGPATVALHQSWVRDVPGARVDVVERAGHNAWIDAPERFRELVSSALANTTSCRT